VKPLFRYFSFLLGFSSIIFETVLIRELLEVFLGNEFFIGVFLGVWLFLIAIGSYTATKFIEKFKCNISFLIISSIALIVFSMFSIVLIRLAPNFLFNLPKGCMPNLSQYLALIFLPLATVSPLLGFQFVILCKFLGSFRETYYLESLGSLFGGLAFNFIFADFFDPFQSIAIVGIILSLSTSLIILAKKRDGRFLSLLFLSFLIISLSIIAAKSKELDKKLLESSYDNVLESEYSKYGHIIVVEKQGEISIYQNGVLLLTSEARESTEPLIKLSLLQNQEAKKILLIGGNFPESVKVLEEISKSNRGFKLSYIEQDEKLLSLIERYLGYFSTNIKTEIVSTDPRKYLEERDERYDLIIVDISSPTSIVTNRYLTKNFFSKIRDKLDQEGVLVIRLRYSEGYSSEERDREIASIYLALNETFPNIVMLPNAEVLIFSKKTKLRKNPEELIKIANDTKLISGIVNENYISYRFSKFNLENFEKKIFSIINFVKANEDLRPEAVYHQSLIFIDITSPSPGKNSFLLIALLFFASLMILIFHKIFFKGKVKKESFIINFMVFTTGFAAMSFSVVSIVVFQVIFGYIYHKIALLTAVFMAGLAFGTYLSNFFAKKFKLKILLAMFEFSIALFSIFLFLPGIMMAKETIFFILVFISAAIVGLNIAIAENLLERYSSIEEASALIYGSDLLGACTASIFISIYIIPLLGVKAAMNLSGVMNFISGLLFIIIVLAKFEATTSKEAQI